MLPESPYNPEFVTNPNIPMAEDPRLHQIRYLLSNKILTKKLQI